MKNQILNNKVIYYIFIFLVVMVAAILNLGSAPLNKGITQNDSAVFQIMGRGMLEGQVIYKDLFDHKGPVMYVINAIAYLISPQIGLFIVEILFIYIGTIFIFKTSEIFVNKKISLIISLFYLMLIFLNISGGNFTEEYAMTFTSIALYFIIRIIYKNEYENKFLWVGIGTTFALNFFIKPTYIAIWISFGIIQFISSVKEKKIKELLRYILYMIIGIMIVALPIAMYLILNNDIKDFINAFFILNMKYSEAGILKKIKAFWILIIRFKFIECIEIGIVCNILILFNKKMNLKNKWFVTCFFIISIILTAWAPNVYIHYLIQLAPAVTLEVIGLCLYIKEYFKENETLKKSQKNLIFITLIFCIILVTGGGILKNVKNFSKILQNGKAVNQELDELKKYLKEDDEMIVLGNQPYYYIYLDKQPQCKYFFQLPIMLYDDSIKEETRNYIMENNPKMLIKYMEGYSEEKFNEIFGRDLENYIKNNYEEYVSKDFKYYVLNENYPEDRGMN